MHVAAIGTDDGPNPLAETPTFAEFWRGRFANEVPRVVEPLRLAEVKHNPRNNRMRAILAA